MPTAIIRVFLLGFLFFGASCSDYDRRWAAQSASPGATDPFEGSYTGTWKSARYVGAMGKLRCILTRQAPNLYRAEFHATWHGIFSSTHTVMLSVTDWRRSQGKLAAKFAGSTEIRMWIGSGRYHCTGELMPGGFVADYDAEYDRGQFQVTRVIPRPAERN
jgi:hypothetical protein